MSSRAFRQTYVHTDQRAGTKGPCPRKPLAPFFYFYVLIIRHNLKISQKLKIMVVLEAIDIFWKFSKT